jgi:hypothetical protein
MFTKGFTKVAALVLSLLALASFASAQDLIEGYMQYNAQQMDYNNAQIGDAINRAMQDPQIQASYNQCVQQGYMCGDLYQFAYNYVTTGGFNDNGAWQRQTQMMNEQQRLGWQGVQVAEQGSANVIAGLNSSIANSQAEWRNVMGGGSTWMDPSTGTGYNLPYGLESGQSWYDAGTGQYYWYNPENRDSPVYYTSQDNYNWQPLNPWHPGQ